MTDDPPAFTKNRVAVLVALWLRVLKQILIRRREFFSKGLYVLPKKIQDKNATSGAREITTIEVRANVYFESRCRTKSKFGGPIRIDLKGRANSFHPDRAQVLIGTQRNSASYVNSNR